MSMKRCTADRRGIQGEQAKFSASMHTHTRTHTCTYTYPFSLSFSLLPSHTYTQHTNTQCWSGSMEPPGGWSALTAGVWGGLWALVLKGLVQAGLLRLVYLGWGLGSLFLMRAPSASRLPPRHKITSPLNRHGNTLQVPDPCTLLFLACLGTARRSKPQAVNNWTHISVYVCVLQP
jgi:hypothetical protein